MRAKWTPSGATLPEVIQPKVLVPATIKVDWKLPEPPVCPECGERAHAAVHNTGDGWTWGWDCCCGPDYFWWIEEETTLGEPFDWPFVEDRSSSTDWERAGVMVV